MRSHVLTGFVSLASVLGLLLAPAPAHARKSFAPIPPDQTGGKVSGLELRIVRYDGATNGVFEVEVKNTRAEPADFSARGLYFVPDGNANDAPQRLGAVGPFNVKTEKGWQRKEKMSLAPGGVARMRLDVYCIDSHRASPGPSTGFHVARGRLPKKVADDILEGAGMAAQGLGGISSPHAKSAVQSEVWKNRDKEWVKLDGDGAQEAGK
jgi:hypothetical protein